jgi:hypothetical protein
MLAGSVAVTLGGFAARSSLIMFVGMTAMAWMVTGESTTTLGGVPYRVLLLAVAGRVGMKFHLVPVAGRDDSVVIVVPGASGGSDALVVGVDLDRCRVHEVDAVPFECRRAREGDVAGAALAERQPDQARVEHEPITGDITTYPEDPAGPGRASRSACKQTCACSPSSLESSLTAAVAGGRVGVTATFIAGKLADCRRHLKTEQGAAPEN